MDSMELAGGEMLGALVHISGLKAAPEHNGKHGHLVMYTPPQNPLGFVFALVALRFVEFLIDGTSIVDSTMRRAGGGCSCAAVESWG